MDIIQLFLDGVLSIGSKSWQMNLDDRKYEINKRWQMNLDDRTAHDLQSVSCITDEQSIQNLFTPVTSKGTLDLMNTLGLRIRCLPGYQE
ncbi:hypothetical protein L2E82_26863 [Cichorium intybus]|uniref:Uncharacterized protein n=1 Tax=Cichorium intybus TaxID=13427 RepID=A0ACB9CRJ1_CICIN|nr:hypothetical protein L2E82_26863 [Cichorium intybus]